MYSNIILARYTGTQAGTPAGNTTRKAQDMRTAYDVAGKGTDMASSRFTDQKQAFALAKALAKYNGHGCFITKIVWGEDNRITEYKTCIVNADGTFKHISR